MTSRTARPMAALARQPGPRAPTPALTPSRTASGPLTISSGATFSSVVCTPRMLKAGSSTASTAARTTGKCWGRQPAMTALAAIFSTVASPRSGSTSPSTSDGARTVVAHIASTRGSVGGTTGSPSVQPRASKSALTS